MPVTMERVTVEWMEMKQKRRIFLLTGDNDLNLCNILQRKQDSTDRFYTVVPFGIMDNNDERRDVI